MLVCYQRPRARLARILAILFFFNTVNTAQTRSDLPQGGHLNLSISQTAPPPSRAGCPTEEDGFNLSHLRGTMYGIIPQDNAVDCLT